MRKMTDLAANEPMQLDIEEAFMEQGEATPAEAGGSNGGFSTWFDTQDAHDVPVEVPEFQIEVAPFELESYITQFSCYGRIQRLSFIAKHCRPLRLEALEYLLKFVKSTTYNVSLYFDIQRQLVEALSAESNSGINVQKLRRYAVDQTWVENTTTHTKGITDKLETELKNYKTNSIKESIRRGYDDLAKHYVICGDLTNALRCYFRSRDYCMGDMQTFTICIAVARLSLYQSQFVQMRTFLIKAEILPDNERNAAANTKLKCLWGLYNLIVGHYHASAKSFSETRFEVATHEALSSIMSPNCVAIYGTLCALATYDRASLGALLTGNLNFKLFLELEPQLREAANKFYESKYPACLTILAELKDAFMLDLYLSPHVETLYKMIRSHALVQYFRPFLSADLRSMSVSFGTNLALLEEELLELILSGKIQARIDSHKKILYAKDVDERLQTFERTLAMSGEWCLKAKAAILKTACARNGAIFLRPETSGASSEHGNSNGTSREMASASAMRADLINDGCADVPDMLCDMDPPRSTSNNGINKLFGRNRPK